MNKLVGSLTVFVAAGMLLLNNAGLCLATEANDAAFELEETVVSATKTEKKVKEVPAGVTVITAQDLQKMHVKTLDDALLAVPGVYIKSQSGMLATKISIRGLSQNRVLVLLDGLPLNNGYTGGASWANIPVENIEKIEIVRGPFSALYGSSAMGGVVNIITKQQEGSHTTATVGAGQQDARNYALSHNGSTGKLEYYFDFVKKETDGYIINPTAPGDGNFGSSNDQYATKFIYHFNGSDKLTVTKGRSSYEYHYDIKTDRAKRAVETLNINYQTALTPDKKLTVQWGELNFSDYWTISGSNYSPNPAKSNEGEIGLDWKVSDIHHLNFGAGSKIDKGDGKTYRLANPAIITLNNLIEQSGGKTKTNYLYFQDEIKLSPQATFYAGGRYDDWSFYDGYNATGALNDKSAGSFSPRASLMVKSNEKTSWYVSAGKSFVSPTVFQLARLWNAATSQLLPNPDLQPEKATSYEIGVNHQISETTTAKVTAFRNNVQNMIYQSFIDKLSDGRDELQWKNAGQAEITGIELEVNHRFSPVVTGFINYTHNNPTITANSDPTLVGKQIPTVPRDAFNLGVTCSNNKLTANILGRYLSRTYETDKNTDPGSGYSSYQPHFVVDTKFIYKFDPRTEVSLAIDNIFDREYYQGILAPGRTGVLQLTYKF